MFSGLRKNANYVKYIAKHKWFVFVECARLGIPLRGLLHDASKFRLDEWGPYREYFYGGKPTTAYTQAKFDKAWLKHIHRNPHHWQFYLLREDDGVVKSLEMPYADVLEMVADWRGAGKAQGLDSVRDWYKKNKDNMHLHPETRDDVERLLREAGEFG